MVGAIAASILTSFYNSFLASGNSQLVAIALTLIMGLGFVLIATDLVFWLTRNLDKPIKI